MEEATKTRTIKPRKPKVVGTTTVDVLLTTTSDKPKPRSKKNEYYASSINPPAPSELPKPKFKKKPKKTAQPPPIMTPTTFVLLTPPPTTPSTPITTPPVDGIARVIPTPLSPLSLALVKAEQRGGTLLQVPTNSLPIWTCYRQHKFTLTMDAVQAGIWCTDCVESLGEKAVRSHLEKRQLDYRCEMSFPSLSSKPNMELAAKMSKMAINSKSHLRFDFFVANYRLLIEVDGEHHFGIGNMRGSLLELLEKLECDQAKDEWIKAEKFSLLRIPFWELSIIAMLIDSTIARIRSGETCLLLCSEDIITWRKQAITALRGKKKLPHPPIPSNAKELATEARQAIRERTNAEITEVSLRLQPPNLSIST